MSDAHKSMEHLSELSSGIKANMTDSEKNGLVSDLHYKYMKRKKVVITGCAGFVGSNVAKRLVEIGHTVTGIDTLEFGRFSNVPEGVRFLQSDFDDYDERFYNKFDVLVHMACSNIIYGMEHPIETFQNNALNTIKLFRKFRGKIVYTSTTSIYGQTSILPTPETAPYNCYNSYDTSKYIAELFLKDNYTTLRLSNVYGTNQHPDHPYSGVIGKMLGNALAGKPIEIIGDGKQTRDFTFVDDVADAVMLAVDRKALNTEVNIASGREVSILELAEKVCALTGHREMKILPERKIDGIRRRCLSIEKAGYMLGWEPKHTLIQGLDKTHRWMQSEQTKKLVKT